jgi:hypothetical protein
MTVTTRSPYHSEQSAPFSEYVDAMLCDNDGGIAERACREVYTLRGSYGRLLQVLVEKGVLDAGDLSRVVGGIPVISLNP